MKTAVLNIKIDPKVKNEAQKVADELGFTLSAIINALLKDLVRNKSISFSTIAPTPFLKRAVHSVSVSQIKKKAK